MTQDIESVVPQQEIVNQSWYLRPELWGATGSLALSVGVAEIATHHAEGTLPAIAGVIMLRYAFERSSEERS